MPFCAVVVLVAGGFEIVNPPTEIVPGTPPLAPSQLGDPAPPAPGHEWHDPQSVVPDALVYALWS
jgi:hypothetical protein